MNDITLEQVQNVIRGLVGDLTPHQIEMLKHWRAVEAEMMSVRPARRVVFHIRGDKRLYLSDTKYASVKDFQRFTRVECIFDHFIDIDMREITA